MFHDMLALEVPTLEKIIRPILIYAVLMILLRVAGKRELGQLNPGDLIVLLTLSNTVQNAIIGPDTSVTGGVIGAITLIAVNKLVTEVTYRRASVRRLVEGEPLQLVAHGEIIRSALQKELITEAELRAALRRQGHPGLSDVETVLLETDGTMSVVPRHPTERERTLQHLEDRLAHIEQLLERLTMEPERR